MSVPTFVVGTGRCGSTMLSSMLRKHPTILSISEFFSVVTEGGRLTESFSSAAIDGRRFWAMISATAPLMTFVLRNHIRYDECIYPCDSPSARFSRQTGVPNILVTTLPHLTEDHDGLFDELQQEVSSWPSAPIGKHYDHLFAWLAEHFGKRLWVERSGAGLGVVDQLMTTFPDAKFIHIARDGRDAAISMKNHPSFMLNVAISMLAQFLGVDPFNSTDRSRIDRVPAELLSFLPERFTAGALNDFQFPIQLAAGNWIDQIANGLDSLRKLPPDRLLTLRYEDFLADPKHQLDTLAAFLGEDYVDEKWSAQCAATVRKPRSTWRDLPDGEANALTEACRPGFELLREAGVEYSL
jgi:putative sulfotransferase